MSSGRHRARAASEGRETLLWGSIGEAPSALLPWDPTSCEFEDVQKPSSLKGVLSSQLWGSSFVFLSTGCEYYLTAF